jgi:hypothetical protein
MSAQLQRLGIAWLREEDWPRWLAIDKDFQPKHLKPIVPPVDSPPSPAL